MHRFLLAGLIFAFVLMAQTNPGTGSIEGRVFHLLTRAPLRKATVVLTAPAAAIRLVADTDAEGLFRFTNLPAGVYRLSASRSGFLERSARRPLEIGADGKVTDAEIRLPPQSVITGRVLDVDGEPLERARVWAFKQIYRDGRRQWERLNASFETNDTGEYRVLNLKPGRYLLQAFNQRPLIDNRFGDPPKLFNIPTYYPSGSSPQQASPVDVGTGAEVRGIDIQILKLERPPSVRVRGKVTGIPADSQSEVSVSLLRAEGAFFDGGNTIARPPDYAFELNAAPGQYTIAANIYSGSPEAYATASLAVTGEVAGVVLAMSPAPRLSGRISVAEEGHKVKLEGVRIALTRLSSSLVSEVRSDAAGRFTLAKAMMPGHYAVVNIRSIPQGCYIREVKLAGHEISWDDFAISTSAQMEIVLSNQAGQITGSAVDSEGKLFPGSSVTLIPPDGKSRPEKTAADEKGNFQFTGLRPGKYKLFAWEEVDDDLWQDPEFLKKHESRTVEITVGPGETQSAPVRVIGAEEIK